MNGSGFVFAGRYSGAGRLSTLHGVRASTALPCTDRDHWVRSQGCQSKLLFLLARKTALVALSVGQCTTVQHSLVRKIYDDVDERLHSVAERSLLALLIKLREDGRAREEDHNWYPTT